MAIVSLSDVRGCSGIQPDLISDADGQAIIDQVVKAVEKYLNAKFTPARTVDVRTGTGNCEIKLYHSPITRLRQVIIDGTYVQPSGVAVQPEAGILTLTSDAEESSFSNGSPNQCKIEYEHAWMERDDNVEQGIISGASYDSGASVTILTNIGGLSANDWVRIYGVDGHDEVVKAVTSTSGTSMLVDRIFVSHANGSLVEKWDAPAAVKRFATVCCSIAWVARVVGASYNEITGYGLAEMNITLGEAYAQFRETSILLEREREQLKASLRPKAVVL